MASHDTLGKILEGYEESKYQCFDNFQQADKLFQNYCAKCRNEKTCKINHEIRVAIGNNYPVWFNALVKLEKNPLIPYDHDDSRPDKIIHCKEFAGKQLSFPF